MNTVQELKQKQQLLETEAYHIKHELIPKLQDDCDHNYEHNQRSSISYFSETCDKCDKTRWI